MAQQELHLVNALKEIFPESSWSWVIPALRRSPLLWSELLDPDFLNDLVQEIGPEPSDWTPGRIGAAYLNKENPGALTWPIRGFKDLSAEISDKAVETYQELEMSSEREFSLSEAFLLSLALLGELDAGKNWGELLNQSTLSHHWLTSLAICYDFVQDQVEYIRTLDPEYGLSVLAAIPLNTNNRLVLLEEALSPLNAKRMESWLRRVVEELPDLAPKIAQTLLSQTQFGKVDIQEILTLSLLNQLAGNNEIALKLLEGANEKSQKLHGKLAANLSKARSNLDLPSMGDNSWQELKQSLSDSKVTGENVREISDVIRSLLENQQIAAAGDILAKVQDPMPDHPELLIAMAEYALAQKQRNRAEELAILALEKSLLGNNSSKHLSRILFQLDKMEECALAAKQYLTKHPDDLETHLLFAKVLNQIGDYTAAAEQAQLAHILNPTDLSIHRLLAEYLEKAESWSVALDIRSEILTKQHNGFEADLDQQSYLPLDDLILYASTAIKANQYQRAITACNQIFEQDENNSSAYMLKGQALVSNGQYDEGVNYLKRAVEISPEQEEHWVALAENQLSNSLPDKAIQTLRSGLAVVSSKGRVLLKLGEIYSTDNPTEALKSYEKAAQLVDSESIDQKSAYDIQYGLGLSYYKLGHLDQALAIFKKLQERYPANEKAYKTYGKLLLDLDQPQDALPLLTKVIDRKPQSADPYLLFADAQLRLGDNHQAAEKAIQDALKFEPDNLQALVLLGEILIIQGKYQKALSSFQKASDLALNSDPAWGPRIHLGLGKTALALDQVETAITSLKEGQERFPQDIHLIKGLADAYHQADLIQNALDTANKVAVIAPSDPETLVWLADFTLGLGAPDQGIAAIKKLIRINPDQHSPYIYLGKAHASAGNIKEAASAFTKILDFEDVEPDDLVQAGDELIKLGKLETGMKILSKAASICGANSPPSPLMPKIWSRLAAGHEQIGETKKSLELLDQAISADLDNPEWRIQKANFLIRQDRLQAAIASLANALDLSPDEPTLHAKMARVQRQVSGFEESFYHAQEALGGFLANREKYQDKIDDARALAADLACATLRDKQAEEILSTIDLESLKDKKSISPAEIHSLCLAAGIALDQNQEVKAAEISNILVSQDCEHPRSLVLQARIINRQGNQKEAQTKYITALDAWKNLVIGERTYSTAVEIAFGKTAQDLQFWVEAEKHFQHAVEGSPTEKRALMELARSYVISAEARRFSEALKAIRRVPNHQAISNKNYKSFQECIHALSQVEVHPDLIKKIQARGEAIFSPSQESAERLKEIADTPEEIAALIGAYRNSRQKVFATQEALDNLTQVGQDPFQDGQIALALLKMKPEAAYKAASGALEAAKRGNSPQLPLFFTLHAIAYKEINDKISAYESIQKALQIWNDEPRWYALAAELSPGYPEAVDFYHKAIELEPEYAHHHLALGKLHLKAKQSLAAVKSFEKAISLKPDYIDAWIQLALGKRSMHRLPEALSTIKKAITLSPDHTEAKKTAALLSFEKGNFRESENHLVALLGQNPNDTDLLALFARTLTAQKQPDQALKVIDKAISLEDDPLELRLQRARMIKDISGSMAAVDELRIIGSHYPEHYSLVLELVSTLAEAGEVDQAVRTAQDALQNEANPYSPEQKAHLFLLTGRLLRKAGQLDQAVHHLYKAKKLVHPNYQAALELSRVHSDRRQYDQALEQTQKAIEIEPEEPEGYYQAGRILKELKEFDRAERMLRKASKLAPHDLKIHRQLGVLVTLNLVHGEPRKEVAV